MQIEFTRDLSVYDVEGKVTGRVQSCIGPGGRMARASVQKLGNLPDLTVSVSIHCTCATGQSHLCLLGVSTIFCKFLCWRKPRLLKPLGVQGFTSGYILSWSAWQMVHSAKSKHQLTAQFVEKQQWWTPMFTTCIYKGCYVCLCWLFIFCHCF